MNEKDGTREECAKVRALTRPAWEVSTPNDLSAFIRHLHVLLPAGSMLVVVGGAVAKDVQRFLRSQQPDQCPEVEFGTFWPKPKVFHVPVTEALLHRLADLTNHHAAPEVCEYLMAYRAGQELLAWYDVGTKDPWYADASVGEEHLAQFCASIGCDYRRIMNPNNEKQK